MLFKHWPICFKHFKSLMRACPKFRSGLPVQSAVKHKITHDGFNCCCITWLTARVLDNHVCIATHNSSYKPHFSGCQQRMRCAVTPGSFTNATPASNCVSENSAACSFRPKTPSKAPKPRLLWLHANATTVPSWLVKSSVSPSKSLGSCDSNMTTEPFERP